MVYPPPLALTIYLNSCLFSLPLVNMVKNDALAFSSSVDPCLCLGYFTEIIKIHGKDKYICANNEPDHSHTKNE